MDKKVRVRFAPSPTGPLHIGGLRTALYNYLFAKKHGGDFILRIEDTDQTRFVPGSEAYLIESLKWCGIVPTEGFGFGDGLYGPYKQSERKPIYREYVNKLIADGKAYYAFDTKEELEAMRIRLTKAGVKSPKYDCFTRDTMKNSLSLPEDKWKAMLDTTPYVVRIKMPRNEEIKFVDLIRGNISVKTHNLDDKVIFKSDGLPTYHLANVVDDYLMKITHVIRADEWLPSAPLHIMLYKYLGWEAPEFAHLSLVLGPDGKKLSKRDGDKHGFPVFPLEWKDPVTGDVSSGYRERGYLPDAFINMMALIGWNPGANIEVMSMDEMIDKFSLDRVNKAGGRFDVKKAEFFNKHYMMKTDNIKLAKMWIPMCPVIPGEPEVSMEYVAKVVGLLKEKVAYLDKFWDSGKYFFVAPENSILRNPVLLESLTKNIDLVTEFKHDGIKLAIDMSVSEIGIDAREAGKLLRKSITGMDVGPPIYDIMELLGKDEVKRRLWKTVEVI